MVYCLWPYKLFRHENQKFLTSLTVGEQRNAFQMAQKSDEQTRQLNEHWRLCGDHFEADCFKRIPGSTRVNLKPESIPTKFCFVEEKTPRSFQQSENRSSDSSQFHAQTHRRMIWQNATALVAVSLFSCSVFSTVWINEVLYRDHHRYNFEL